MVQKLLYERNIVVNDKISIYIPTVGEVLDHEEPYYQSMTSIIATPFDMMVQLYDAGVDFTTINDFELFCIMFQHIRDADTSMLFKDLDLSKFVFAKNTQNGNIILFDEEHDIVIDRLIHYQICEAIRKIHFLKKPLGRPGNSEAKKYMIERARIKQKRSASKQKSSDIEGLIVALVNTEQFKYDFDSVRNLTLYQFNASLHQIIHKVNYEHLMGGCYAGTVDMKKIDPSKINWLTPTL